MKSRQSVFSSKALSSIACLMILSVVCTVHAAWPEKVFAPYMYTDEGDDFRLASCYNACGLKYYTLAFIIALQSGDDKNANYAPVPSWDGNIPMERDFYQDQIRAIRERGGDVIMSFGGEAGKELANVIDDPSRLQAAYQGVIDRYKFTWLDFDIEGGNLEKGGPDSDRRNTALAALQKANPGLIISYTLPVDPEGLSDESIALLTDAVKKGVRIHSVNLMVMFFGKDYVNHGKSEAQLGIDSANRAHNQLAEIDPAIRTGLCPCLGENGSPDEVFTLDDAKTLRSFADSTPWICSLHFWNINKDAGLPGHLIPGVQSKPWAFTKVFQSFTTASQWTGQ